MINKNAIHVRLVVEVEAAIGRADIGHIRFRHVQGQLRVGAQIRLPVALARQPLRKIRPSACQSRISMRRAEPDLRPCVEMSTSGCSSMAARRAESMAVSFLGAMSMRRAHEAS
jgi:hypothetical protein